MHNYTKSDYTHSHIHMGGSKQCDASFQKLRSISKKYKKQKMANEDKKKSDLQTNAVKM